MLAEIVDSLDRTVAFIRQGVSDLSDAEMTLQPAGVPNHAAWTLGHLVFSFQSIAVELGATPWLTEEWERRFAYGSTPEGPDAPLPSRDALLAALADASGRLRGLLLAADEARLAAPLPDEEMRRILPTVGHALVQVVVAHTAFHAGQLAAWRRAVGRPPAGVFL